MLETITDAYEDKDRPTLKFRWDRWVDLRGADLAFSSAYRCFRETALNGHMQKCHKFHQKPVSLFNTQEKKNLERRKKVKLDVYKYEEASDRHQQVVFQETIERVILSLPEEEDNNNSSGDV